MADTHTPSYPVDQVNKVKRMHERGTYDHESVHAILDSASMCHVSYVIDGQPFCTPTLFWREGTKLYWHGSSASRMLRNQKEGEPVCLTVTHLDSFILARSGMHHSADYRSVMAFGHAKVITDTDEKHQALVSMVDRLFPNRTAGLREINSQEFKATTVIGMEIEKASAKVRAGGVADDEEDYALPIYAERLPVHVTIGKAEPCPRLIDGVERSEELQNIYPEGRRLDEALTEAYKTTYPA
ncbi:pyridoxamine 5'-phosphate oxidase family protein [Minwuia sp.]|uniref:pyridoxamine 5'-phosphate oxidase family protein n=1 Tax=Minwuia sp. TaxID=2493630 RepID=UPI003A954C42